MWNTLLGKSSGGAAPAPSAEANPPTAAGGADATTTADAPEATATAPSANADAAAADEEGLVGITYIGVKWKVRLSVGNADVSAPEDDGDEMEDEMMEVEGEEGLDRTISDSTKTSTATSMDQDPATAKPPAENEATATDPDQDEAAPRRGRSASIGEAGEVVESSAFSREESAASDAPATPTPAAAAAQEGNFEASLLLGIAESSAVSSGVMTPQPDKERREPSDPAVLPTSMTSFLDMLTEDQRRVRHRYIPGVEGFRKLYKSEAKGDLTEARRMKKAKHLGKEGERGSDMDVDEAEDDAQSPAEGHDEHGADKVPAREAFVAPDQLIQSYARRGQPAALLASTAFETKAAGVASGTPAFKSPCLVDSLVSFDPPRPQESTAHKTRHRLKRWEAHPSEVESDLANYRKTVTKTRDELHAARKERERIETVASLMRIHFANHLVGYRSEMVAANGELQTVTARCLQAEEEHKGRSMSTRGNVRGMRDVLGTLKALGEEAKGAANDGEGTGPAEWRAAGVGGVGAQAVAGGWILVGDEVKVKASGDEGTVVSVNGPGAKKDAAKSEDDEKDAEAKKPEPTSKEGDAMDVDAPEKKKEAVDAPEKDEGGPVPPSIGVKLAKTGEVKRYAPSELEFGTTTLPHLDPSLAQRWEAMVATALANGVGHDVAAMDDCVNAALARRNADEDDAADEKQQTEGSASPKSVAQVAERALLPFGAGLVAAPADVSDYPSLIPSDALEQTVRKVTYEAAGPRVIPNMAAASSEMRKFEARQEEMNRLKGKVLQLRNRLGRQKRLRSLNERSLAAGKHRAHKVEGLLLEMQMDLKNLKGRLQDELNELGIGNAPLPSTQESGDTVMTNDPLENGESKAEGGKPVGADEGTDSNIAPGVTAGGSGEVAPLEKPKEEITADSLPKPNGEGADNDMERESKRARVEEANAS